MDLTWSQIQSILDAGRHAILNGPPGTGKTRIATTSDCYSLTLTLETPAAELRGHFVPKGKEFVWFDGPVLRAWREGRRIVLNEIDQASGDALTFLYAALDDPAVARITLPTGETVRPHPGFQAIATTNSPDLSAVLPEALLDRFAIRITCDEPHPSALVALGDKALAALVKKTISSPPGQRVSLRQAFAFNGLREAGIDPAIAAKAVFGKERADAIVLTISSK